MISLFNYQMEFHQRRVPCLYITHPLITTLSPPLGHHQSNSNTLMAHQVLIYYDSHQTTNVPDEFDQIFRAHV